MSWFIWKKQIVGIKIYFLALRFCTYFQYQQSIHYLLPLISNCRQTLLYIKSRIICLPHSMLCMYICTFLIWREKVDCPWIEKVFIPTIEVVWIDFASTQNRSPDIVLSPDSYFPTGQLDSLFRITALTLAAVPFVSGLAALDFYFWRQLATLVFVMLTWGSCIIVLDSFFNRKNIRLGLETCSSIFWVPCLIISTFLYLYVT